MPEIQLFIYIMHIQYIRVKYMHEIKRTICLYSVSLPHKI